MGNLSRLTSIEVDRDQEQSKRRDWYHVGKRTTWNLMGWTRLEVGFPLQQEVYHLGRSYLQSQS